MKKCTFCKQEKSISLFHKNKSRKDGHGTVCKDCRSEYHKKWYRQGKKDYVVKNKKVKLLERQEYILNYLYKNPCVDCGESDPIVLEFDHQRDKKFNISKGIHEQGIEKLKKEVEKCEVVCSNCHKRRTAKSQSWYKMID